MYEYGMRFDDDSNAITQIDEESQTAFTYGNINGDPVTFGLASERNFSAHVETITVSNLEVPANGGKNAQVAAPVLEGYKMVGIIGWECSVWEVAPSKLTTVVNGGLVWFSLANASTSAKTVSFTIKALYLPDTWSFT